MQDNQSFRPAGRTHLIPASSPVSGATRLGGPTEGDVAYFFYNSGIVDGFLGYGPTSGAAIAAAVVPLVGSPREVLTIPAGSIQTFTLSPELFFAGVTPGGPAPIYITPGRGV